MYSANARNGATQQFMSLLVAVIASAYSPVAHAQPALRDSSGVKIHSVILQAPTGRVQLSATPLVDIGSASAHEAEEFHRVSAAIRMDDGTIAVFNTGTFQLRYFSSQGKFLATAGRRGNGPGEFQGLGNLFLAPGDTLLVSDDMLRRISAYGPDRKLVRTVSFAAPPQDRRTPSLSAVLVDGTLVGSSPDIRTAPPRPEPYLFTQHLLAYSAKGQYLRDLGVFNASEHFVQHVPAEMGGTAYWDLAFGRRNTTVAAGNHLLIGDGTTFEIRQYSPDGKLEEIFRAGNPPKPLTQQDRELYRQIALSGIRDADREVEQKSIDEMPFPTRIPAYSRFLRSHDGRIWVNRYPWPPTLSETWVILEADGRFVDEVVLPKRFKLFDAGPDFALGVWRDGDDVEHIQMYRVNVKR